MRRTLSLLALATLLSGTQGSHAQQPRVEHHGDPLPKGALQRLGTLRYRQDAPITSFAFAPDGKTYATAANTDDESSVRLWDTATGREVLRCVAPEAIGQVAFAADGKSMVASCGDDLYFWDTKTGKKLRHFQGHPGGVGCFAFSPDGKTLAVGSKRPTKDDGYTIRLLDAATGKLLRTFEKHFTWINVVAFSRDGTRLASASTTFDKSAGSPTIAGMMCVWDITTGQKLHQLPLSGADLYYSFDQRSNVAFSPDLTSVAFAAPDEDLQVQVWDVAAAKKRWVVPERLHSFAFTADGSQLIAGWEYEPVRAYDAMTGKRLRDFTGVGGWGRNVAGIDPTGKYVATVACAYFGQIRLWDLASARELTSHHGHQDGVTFVQMTADGKRIVTAGDDHTVRFWDAGTGKLLDIMPGYGHGLNSTALTPDGKTLVSCGSKGGVLLLDLPMGKPRPLAKEIKDGLHGIALSPDGKVLARGGMDSLSLYDIPTGKLRAQFPVEAHEMCFGPDSQLLVTAGNDLRFWHVPTSKEVLVLRPSSLPDYGSTDAGQERYWAVAMSPDGRWLATSDTFSDKGTSQNKLGLWEVATGQRVLEISGLSFFATALAFTPDGSLLIANTGIRLPNENHDVTFWDVRNGQFVGGIDGHFLPVTALHYTPDGRTFLTGSTDGNVLVWDPAVLPRAKPLAPRPLSAAELTALWEDLVSSNARKAYQAIMALSAGGKSSVGFLQERLQPAKLLPAAQLDQLIADLNHDRYAVRARAMAILETQDEPAVKALRAALKDGMSLELRLRIELLLGKLERFVPPPGELRKLRALAVLERIGTAEARTVLESLMSGTAETRLTREARAALGRLGPRK